ncbi:MAG: hypothetical protein GF320_02525 [Armatimonadia bacterium]|nr:hypothetical protein [Armatimonadia bacterium]
MRCLMAGALLCLAYFAGCAGGAGSIPGDQNGDGDDGSGGAPTEQVTDEQRDESLGEVTQLAASLPDADIPTENRALVETLQAREHIIDAGVDENSETVYATYSDGLTVNFIRNRLPQYEAAAGATAVRDVSEVAARAGEVARGGKAYVGNGLGSCYPSAPSDASRIAGYLSAAGYDVNQLSMTVDSLKSIKNASVLFLNTHGTPATLIREVVQNDDGSWAVAPDDEAAKTFVLWTATPANRQTIAKYQTELREGQLAIVSADHNQTGDGGCTSPAHLAITAAFVHQHWSFAPGSVAWVQACFSGAPEFAAACAASGAGVYAGWDKVVAGAAAPVYFFDRGLARNDRHPADPPIRAFGWKQLHEGIQDQGLDQQAVPTSFAGIEFRNPVVSGMTTLGFTEGSPAASHIAPSIRKVTPVESMDSLQIFGAFGDKQGTVEVGGTELNVTSWSKDHVVCDLPPSGPGSTGDVVVTVDGVESNEVPLTEWRGTMTYTVEGEGSLKREYTIELQIRGDIHTFRERWDDDPKGGDDTRGELGVDSTCEWKASGEDTNVGSSGTTYTTKWIGEGQLPMLLSDEVIADPDQPGINSLMEFQVLADSDGEPDYRQMRLLLAWSGKHDMTVEHYENGSLTSSNERPVTLLLIGGLYDKLLQGLPALEMEFDSSYNIRPGKKTGTEGSETTTVEWETLTARNVPDSADARAASPG